MILRTNKTLFAIFILSLFIYLLSCLGIFDSLSASFSKFLFNTLGYTNRWSKSFGPIWYVRMNSDISALGSRELVLLFAITMYFYLKLTRGKSDALQFLFTIGLGIIVILVTKSITSKHDDLNLTAILFETLSNFPSGHTFIATVLYFTIAQHLTSKKNSNSINQYLFIAASIFSLVIGISRFMANGHTVTEVIAGWSLGLCWFTFAQMFLRIDHKKVFNK